MDRRGATSLPVLIEELSPVCLANFSRNMLSLNLLCTAVNSRGYVLQTRDPAPFLSERIFHWLLRILHLVIDFPSFRSRCQCEGLICRYADANAPITNGNDFCDSFLPVGGEMEHQFLNSYIRTSASAPYDTCYNPLLVYFREKYKKSLP